MVSSSISSSLQVSYAIPAFIFWNGPLNPTIPVCGCAIMSLFFLQASFIHGIPVLFWHVTTLLFFLIIPVFSFVISSIVLPKMCMWSYPMSVKTAISASQIVVGSFLPPIPTSSTAISTFFLEKYSNAIVVQNSKNFSCIPRLFTSFMSASSSSSLIFCPFIFILSLNFTRCGEVYRPTFLPALFSTSAIIAAVLPFPFVPVICITRKFLCGFPSRLIASEM